MLTKKSRARVDSHREHGGEDSALCGCFAESAGVLCIDRKMDRSAMVKSTWLVVGKLVYFAAEVSFLAWVQ